MRRKSVWASRIIFGGSQLIALVMCLVTVFRDGIMLGWIGALSTGAIGLILFLTPDTTVQ
jgi:hypothetical protein